MAIVYWLDDEPESIRRLVEHLRRKRHDVRTFVTEDDLIRACDELRPNVLITDLEHPASVAQVRGGTPRLRGDDGSEGWHLYEETLRPYLPDVPVLIYSRDAARPHQRARADEFNLHLLEKGDTAAWELDVAMQELVSAQIPVVKSRVALPAFVVADFSKVNEALLRHLGRRPEDLHQLTWASFEELVARLLVELGYEIERTPLTRDGGVDLWALQHSLLGDTLYAIDAKKYSSRRPVGPEPVRAIHGVISHTDATVGMIVTTSSFGPSALEYAGQHRYRLALRDFDDVQAWIRRVTKAS